MTTATGLTVFAVNRDPNESYDMCIKLLDLEDFSGKEHIEMCGFDKNAVNGFDKINVFPVNGEIPTVDGKTGTRRFKAVFMECYKIL